MNAAARLYTLTGTDLATTRRNATRGRREEREGGGGRGRRKGEIKEEEREPLCPTELFMIKKNIFRIPGVKLQCFT